MRVPQSVVDDAWEQIDPYPNILNLFNEFNKKFFWNKLKNVEIKWSSMGMARCAGLCKYIRTNKECVITLSTPLLHQRPRKDLVQTLLHEMIHAYLFVTNNYHDIDGHGPEFQYHMERINIAEGTEISIYHNFHKEAKAIRKHVWRCNGPCRKRRPYFGYCKKSIDCPPDWSDSWFKFHASKCNGQFIKIQEPQKFDNSLMSINKLFSKESLTFDEKLQLLKFNESIKLNKSNSSILNNSNFSNSSLKRKNDYEDVNESKIFKNSNIIEHCPSCNKNIESTNFTKHLENCLSNINFDDVTQRINNISINIMNKTCPVCQILIDENLFNDHLEICKNNIDRFFTQQDTDIMIVELKENCPLCQRLIEKNSLMEHLEKCLNNLTFNTFDGLFTQEDINRRETIPNELKEKCPICEVFIEKSKMNDHLDQCLNSSSLNNFDEIFTQEKINKKENCPLCQAAIDKNYLNKHLEKCLGCSNFNNLNECLTQNKIEKTNLTELNEKCPVCEVIVDENELNKHLQMCLNQITFDRFFTQQVNNNLFSSANFNEDNESLKTHHNISTVNLKEECPLCLASINKNDLNDHLKSCLSSQNFDDNDF